jgi:hypothetical protein
MYNILLLFILLVSVVDQFCLITWVTYEIELNPIGKLLIMAGGIPFFAAIKAGGTALTLWLLYKLRHTRFAMPVIIGTALFQAWLLYFLFFGA